MDYSLLEGEEMIASMDSDKVLLSNKRLRIIEEGSVKSISLSQISYVQSNYTTNYRFLSISFLGVFLMIDNSNLGPIPALMLIAGLILTFFIKNHYFIVNSSGGSIKHKVSGTTIKDINRFVYLVDEQINLNK